MGVLQTLSDAPFQVSPSSFITWLSAQGIEEDIVLLFDQHSIGELSFGLLIEDDLREMGIRRIGVRKRIISLIKKWRKHAQHTPTFPETFTSSEEISSSSSLDTVLSENVRKTEASCDLHVAQRHRCSQNCTQHSAPLSDGEGNPKLWKVAVSFLYCLFSLGVTSYVMVLAHERLPDSSKYPPLPDILLDNLPYIPWAFEAAELVGMLLAAIWCVVLICHRHRFILLRRYCSLIGTVFLLRSITMFITSLSVPGHHLSAECQPFVFDSFRERASRALDIWLGLGLTLKGVRTCGDYMFSGHTTVITMLNFFITEYTPSNSMHPLHTFTWILNVFGIFFILAAHEHYSIDVFIAVYITSRLFLYYHWLANNLYLMGRDLDRTKIWFPLFSFFEADVQGVVPAEFCNPFIDFKTWVNCQMLAFKLSAKFATPLLHEKVR